jgi:ribonuclease MRP protein subunit RMP1
MAAVLHFQPTLVGSDDIIINPIEEHPKITADALLNATIKDQQSLMEIHDLLNSLFIRNRNQHRRNHWFKSLQQFRKQLALLLQELNVDVGKKSQKLAAKAEKLTTRLQYWDEKCIHQWYL